MCPTGSTSSWSRRSWASRFPITTYERPLPRRWRARKERPMTTTTSKQREAALVSDRWLRPMMGLGAWEALPARDVPYELSDPYILLHDATLRPSQLAG